MSHRLADPAAPPQLTPCALLTPRLVAELAKLTYRPSSEMTGTELSMLPASVSSCAGFALLALTTTGLTGLPPASRCTAMIWKVPFGRRPGGVGTFIGCEYE